MIKTNLRYVLWVITGVGLLVAAYSSKDVISTTAWLNTLSYWGTVATLAALLLAITEIAYSIQTTKSLQLQTEEALDSVRRVEDASTVSDCIAAIDLASGAVLAERYDAALSAFQHFRKLCAKALPKLVLPTRAMPSAAAGSTSANQPAANTASLLNDLGQVELKLMSATRVNASAGLTKAQKHEMLERLLAIKEAVEHRNPANRTL